MEELEKGIMLLWDVISISRPAEHLSMISKIIYLIPVDALKTCILYNINSIFFIYINFVPSVQLCFVIVCKLPLKYHLSFTLFLVYVLCVFSVSFSPFPQVR